jgi:hypothetical protein
MIGASPLPGRWRVSLVVLLPNGAPAGVGRLGCVSWYSAWRVRTRTWGYAGRSGSCAVWASGVWASTAWKI